MEFILCPAIKRLIPREVDCKYHNNDINRIEIGFRHHDILIRFKWEVSDDAKDQGFLTSHGRFVNREEGYKLALEASQITEKYDKTLYSEDLY